MKRTRRRRGWLWLGGVLLGLVVLVVAAGAIAVRTPWFEDQLGSVIVKELEKATHERASLDRAQVTFWPLGAELTGLTLTEDESGEVFATVERIRAPLVLRDASVKLGQLRIDRPHVVLHLEKDGKLRELRAPPPDPDEPPLPPGKPLTELPWYALGLTDGHLELRLPEGHVTVEGLDLSPGADGRTRVTGRLDLAWQEFADGADLDLADVLVGPHVIEVPRVDVALESLQVEGNARLPLGGELDANLTLHSEIDRFSPLLPGARFLEGSVDADVRLRGEPADPIADVVVSAIDFAYDAPGKVWPRVRYTVDSVTAQARATRREISVISLVAREEDGTVTATGVVAPVAQPDGTDRWEVTESHVLGEGISLAALLRAFSAAPNPWVDFVGDAEAHVSGPLAPLELAGPFEVAIADFTVRQGPVHDPVSPEILGIPTATLTGELTVYKDHIVLDGEDLQTGGNQGTVVADIGFGPQGPLDLTVDLVQTDLRVLRPLGGSELTGTGRLRGRLWGDFNALQARGRGTLNGFSVSGIPYADVLDAKIETRDMKRLTLSEARGLRGQTRYYGSWSMDFAAPGLPMDTDVVITEGRAEDLVSMFVDLGDVISGKITDGSLTLVGPLNDMDGAAHLELADVTLVGETFETGRADGWMHGGTFTLDDLRVRRNDGEGLTLRGSVGREWKLDLEGSGELRLETLDALSSLSTRPTGRVSGVVRIDNTLFDPAPHGVVRVWDATWADQELPDSVVHAETTDGFLVAHGEVFEGAVDADLSLGLWEEQPYTLTANFESFPLDRFWPVAADGQDVLARVTGELELWGTFGERWSPVEIRARVPRVVLGWDEHTLVSTEDRPWRFSATGTTWSLDDAAIAGGRTSLSMSASGRDGAVLVVGGGNADADLLRAVVPGLTRSEGNVEVRLASMGGRGEAETHVDLVLDAPLIRHEAIPGALEDVRLRAELTPDQYLVTHFESDVGGGRMVGDAGRVPRIGRVFDGSGGEHPVGIIETEAWVPKRFDLFAKAQNVQMQWVEDLPPAVGDATIAFDGPADGLLLHADVDVTDMSFTERIEWEDWVVALEEYLLVAAPPTDEPPWFGLDIDIRADRTIRLLNNVSDATASAQLTMLGDTSRMGLVGRVRITDGVLYVQDRAFDVQRGELRFDDPFSWDPLLDFDLRADIASRARQYRVSYRITGPYSAWTSTTESEPRLPQSDVNALLWFGVTADDLEDMGELTNAVGLAAADFVVKDFVQNDYLGLGLGDAGVLDLAEVDLNTGVNLRGEYSSEPRVLIKRRWSPTLSTQAEINLIRDDHFVRLDWRADEAVLLSSWWASRRREGYALPISGALGVDLRFVQEIE